MCYNAQVSLNTWYFAIFGFLVGLFAGFPLPKLLFALLFSSMQLVEYFLWKYIDDPKKNRFYSKMGHLILIFEPLFAIFMIPHKMILYGLSAFYILFLILFHLYNYQKIHFYTRVGKNGHLDWQFSRNLGDLYGLIWFGLFFTGIYMSKDIVFLWGGILSLLFTLYSEKFENTFTSKWCYISNIVWIYIILCALFSLYNR